LIVKSAASLAFFVGGNLMENNILSFGCMTLPALSHVGNPSNPIIVFVAYQV